MRLTLLLPCICLLASSRPASAHVRWFVSAEEAQLCPCHPHPYVVGALLLLAGLGVGILSWLYRGRRRSWFGPGILPWLSLPLGFSLLWAAALGQYRSPDVPLEGWGLRALEVACGLLLASGRPPRWTGLALALFYAAGWWVAPAPVMLENVDLLGFALLVGFPGRAWAYPLLRLTVGASLMLLGLSEKLLNPALSLVFLEKYHWNFVPGMSDMLFVYLAGTVEVFIGALLALGSWPRQAGLAVLIAMLTTMTLLGPLEVVGHAPYLALTALEALQGLPRLSPFRRLAPA